MSKKNNNKVENTYLDNTKYTILTWGGCEYSNLDDCVYNSYSDAYEAVIATQEMDIANCIGVSTSSREETLEEETPREQIIVADYDGENIPDDAEVYDSWIVD